MTSWKAFKEQAPQLAAFAEERLSGGVAYLATIRKNGAPRVHPVTPILTPDNIFLFMEPTSPKGYDLRRDGRYALHNAVENSEGGQGECFLHGHAHYTEDPTHRQTAAEYGYRPKDHYILFRLEVSFVLGTTYPDDQPHRERWSED